MPYRMADALARATHQPYRHDEQPSTTPPAAVEPDELRLKFFASDLEAAKKEWGCNCGPAAVAAFFRLPLPEVRSAFGPNWPGITNIPCMRAAVARAGGQLGESSTDPYPADAIARVQFGGPWMTSYATYRWACTKTHWVAWRMLSNELHVYDVNTGWVPLAHWQGFIGDMARNIERSDGTWQFSHAFPAIRTGGLAVALQ